MPDDLSDPWQTLLDNRDVIAGKKYPERFYQVQFWMPKREYESLFFFLALEVENIENIPIQFTAKTLPEQQYLRFYHRGYANQVGLTYDYIYNNYLPDTNFKLPHHFNFEYYGKESLGPYNENSVSEIYIPVTV